MSKVYCPSNLEIRWLIDPVKGDSVSTVPASAILERHDFPFPPELGHGWLERMPLADGIAVFRSVHSFRPEASGQLIPLGEFDIVFPDTTLMVQTAQGHEIYHREFYPAPTAELILKPGFDCFRHTERVRVLPLINSSSNSVMTGMSISDTALAEQMGEDMAQQLIASLGLDIPPLVKIMPIPLHTSALLRASMSAVLTGPLKRMFAQSKLLEYLCALATFVITQPPATLSARRRRDRVRELHAYLMQLEGKLPSLDELGVLFGMSARWLNNEFAKEYGLPICAFIIDRRLNEAHAALLESNLPIKAISERLCYSHANHFATAFKKKFGYSPGSLRRERRTEDSP
jgi:AraC-like DNA-binding protein